MTEDKRLLILGSKSGGGGNAVWGQITGTLSDQTDLKDALDAKADSSSIPTATSDLTNDSGYITLSDVPAQVQANWNESDTTSPAYIVGKPTIPAAQIQSDWNQSDNTAVDYIKNKPSMSTETLTFVDANNVSTTVVVYTQPQI